MNIIKQNIPITNYEVNRRGKNVKKVVIHWFGVGKLKDADAQFKKLGGGTSAHYGIEDNNVYQWVDEKDTAYHAGKFDVNLESIGIEHSAEPNRPASEQTYKTSAELLAQICKKYNIPLDRSHIIKHSEVPRATACPGTMDLDRIIELAKGTIQPSILTDPTLSFDFKGLQAFDGAEVYNILQMETVGAKLIAKDRRIKELESPIFKKKIAIHFFELAKEFEK